MSPPKVNRTKPVMHKEIDGVIFIAYDLLQYFNTDFPHSLGYIAEPADRSIVGDISATSESLDDAFRNISALYTYHLKKSFGIKE